MENVIEASQIQAFYNRCLSHLVRTNRVVVYAFVIMDNHIHIIWQRKNDEERAKLQNSLLRNTAQKFKKDLVENHPQVLLNYKVNAKDRTYQFWERNSLSIDLISPTVFKQKLDYIHNNPFKAKLCNFPEEYYFSSASIYYYGKTDFKFLTRYDE